MPLSSQEHDFDEVIAIVEHVTAVTRAENAAFSEGFPRSELVNEKLVRAEQLVACLQPLIVDCASLHRAEPAQRERLTAAMVVMQQVLSENANVLAQARAVSRKRVDAIMQALRDASRPSFSPYGAQGALEERKPTAAPTRLSVSA
jgi:hypothetical protein